MVFDEGDADDPGLELGEAVELAFGVEEDFVFQGEQLVVDGAFDGGEGVFADDLLVVEDAHHVVEVAGVDGLGDVGDAAGFEYAFDLEQGLVHLVERDVVQ